ncbi:MAG: hypothetical protein KAJ34_03915, partial [Thermodesulfovibrionia bacterium]|nr:hypothetical protein [Thermodesulfovibrionia bacterium]
MKFFESRLDELRQSAENLDRRKLLHRLIFTLMILFLSCSVLIGQQSNEDIDLEKLILEQEDLYSKSQNNKELEKNLSVLYHNHAIKIAENQDWLKAIAEEEKAMALSEDEEIFKKTMAGLLNAYALDLRKQQRFNDALSQLKLAFDYAPQQSQLGENIAIIYLDLAYKAFQNDEYNNSSYLLRSAAAYDEDNPYIYVLTGELAYKRDDYYDVQRAW